MSNERPWWLQHDGERGGGGASLRTGGERMVTRSAGLTRAAAAVAVAVAVAVAAAACAAVAVAAEVEGGAAAAAAAGAAAGARKLAVVRCLDPGASARAQARAGAGVCADVCAGASAATWVAAVSACSRPWCVRVRDGGGANLERAAACAVTTGSAGLT